MINRTMGKMIEYYRGDPKRIQHFIKVYALAHSIAEGEGMEGKQLFILDIAALLHDIGIKISEEKYNSSAGRYQELEGPAQAEKLLCELGAERSVIERVCYLVGHHHTYDNIQGMDYQILVEADFLVNLYEDNETMQAVQTVKEHIFKTETGKKYISDMFGL